MEAWVAMHSGQSGSHMVAAAAGSAAATTEPHEERLKRLREEYKADRRAQKLQKLGGDEDTPICLSD